MSLEECTPRISARHLERFAHQTVRIVGKVVSLRGELATIEADGSVTVHLNRDAHLVPNNAAEIIGKVQDDLTVKCFKSTDFGTNFDYAAANAVVEITHKYKKLFYDAGDEL